MKREKIVSLLLAGAMAMSMAPSVLAEEIAPKDVEMVNQLKGYGILQGDENNNLNLDKPITRTEMAVLTLRILGYENSASAPSGSEPFSDVALDFWGNGYISFAKGMGIIDGFEDGTFRPQENVMSEQSIKMIVAALGYGNMMRDIIYPDSYMSMASQLKLFDGTDCKVGEPITRGNVARLIYNALDVAQVVNVNGKEFVADPETTIRKLLEKRAGLVMYEGIVTADDEINLYSSQQLPKDNSVLIDGKIYEVDPKIDTSAFVGKTVQFFLRDDNTGNYIVDMAEKKGKNNEVIINDVSDLDSFSNNTLYYYDGSKNERLRLSEKYTVALNGRQYTPLFDFDKFTSLDAELKFIDNDDDNYYDVVMVEGSESAVVDKVIPSSELIVMKYNMTINGGKTLLCEESDVINRNIKIVDADGNDVALTDIQPEDVISVYSSDNGEYMKIVVTSNSFEGVVEQLSLDDNLITVDGKDYQLAAGNSYMSDVDVSLGYSYEFFTNSQGKIFYADERNASNTYYYVMNKYMEEGESGVGVKLISDKKEIAKYNFANSVSIDGERVTDFERIYDEVPTGTLINISMDSENKIKKIDTVEAIQDDFAQREYTDEYDDEGERIRFDGTQIFTTSSNKPFAVNENTAIFFIPTSQEPGKVYDDNDYQENYELKRGRSYKTQAFDFDSETQLAKAVIVQVNPDTNESININEKSPIGIISGISKGMVDEDETIVLDMYVNGELIQNTVPESSDAYDKASELKVCDVIRYNTDYNGYVRKIDKMFTMSDVEGQPYFHTGANSPEEKYFGKVKNVTLNYLSTQADVYVNKVTLLDGDKEADSFEFHTNVNNVFRITNDRKLSAEASSFYDIKCADDLGIDNASKVFMYEDLTKPLFIVIMD